MRHVNRHTILGYVGSVTQLKNAIKISVAANREWNSDGERKSFTDWVQLTSSTKIRPIGSQRTYDRAISSMPNPGFPTAPINAMAKPSIPQTCSCSYSILSPKRPDSAEPLENGVLSLHPDQLPRCGQQWHRQQAYCRSIRARRRERARTGGTADMGWRHILHRAQRSSQREGAD